MQVVCRHNTRQKFVSVFSVIIRHTPSTHMSEQKHVNTCETEYCLLHVYQRYMQQSGQVLGTAGVCTVFLTGQCSRYGLWTADWTGRCSSPCRGKRFVCCTKRSNRFWGPPSLPLNGYRGQGGRGVMFTTYRHLALKLRTSGAMPLLPLLTFVAWTRASLIENKRTGDHV